MANTGTRIVEKMHVVNALSNILPSTSTPSYVSMKNYNHCTVIIAILNQSTVTGSAITLKQATNVGNTLSDEKALAFDTVWANADVGASDTLVKTAVVSNTFTPGVVNSKKMLYIIEVDAESLDVDGGFDCIRAGTADAVAQIVTVLYVLSGQRYQGQTANRASALLD